MKWVDKVANALTSAKNILSGTLTKMGIGEVQAAEAVDALTDKLEAPLALFIKARFPALPYAIAQGAAKHALDYVDAAVAGMLAAKK